MTSNMKNYPAILRTVDRDFEKALKNLQSDPLFSSSQLTYTDDDKRRIALLWWAVVKPFLELRRILRSFMWRSFLFFGSKNAFVIKYATVNTYYNMVYELRSIFGPHEEFLRRISMTPFLRTTRHLRDMYIIRDSIVYLHTQESIFSHSEMKSIPFFIHSLIDQRNLYLISISDGHLTS